MSGYWNQQAELQRQAGGMALAPDAPIWMSAGKVSSGTLSAMMTEWENLPPSHQRHHVIQIHGVTLDGPRIRDMIDQPQCR
jgi:hypothetical protein